MKETKKKKNTNGSHFKKFVVRPSSALDDDGDSGDKQPNQNKTIGKWSASECVERRHGMRFLAHHDPHTLLHSRDNHKTNNNTINNYHIESKKSNGAFHPSTVERQAVVVAASVACRISTAIIIRILVPFQSNRSLPVTMSLMNSNRRSPRCLSLVHTQSIERRPTNPTSDYMINGHFIINRHNVARIETVNKNPIFNKKKTKRKKSRGKKLLPSSSSSNGDDDDDDNDSSLTNAKHLHF